MGETSREEQWAGLMRASLAGDAAAYRRLLADLATALRLSVRAEVERMGQGNADVEDIVQETLLAVHLKRHTWDPALPFSPWFKTVARYKTVDALRRRGRRRQVPLDDGFEIAAPPEADALSERDADRLLATLGERPARVVRAVSLEGRSAAEVGADLGMSEGAVRVTLHRALKDLAKRFRGDGT